MTPGELDRLLRITLANSPGGICQIESSSGAPTVFIRRTNEDNGCILDPGLYKILDEDGIMWNWVKVETLAYMNYIPTEPGREKPRLDPEEFEERTV